MLKINYSSKEFEILVSDKKYIIDFEKQINMEKLRNEFNGIISSMAIKNNKDILFHILRLSERNSLSNAIFLNFCRIKLIENLRITNKTIIINTNQYSIYTYFKRISKTSIIDKFIFFYLINFEYLVSILRPFKRVIQIIHNKLLCVGHKKLSTINNAVIIQTFASDSSFKNHHFYDLYYEDLKTNFISKKRNIKTWPIFYNLNKKREALNYFKQHKDNFIILENYLKWIDIFEFLKKSFLFKLFKPYRKFDKKYKYYNFIKYWVNTDSIPKEYFYYIFIKNLKLLSCKNLSFVFNQENLIPQKVPLLAIKKYFPNSKTFGYFHTTKPRNLLSLDYCSKEEFKDAPRPKIILFNSHYYRKFFKKKWPNLYCEDVISLKMNNIIPIKLNRRVQNNKILLLIPEVIQDAKYFLSLTKNIPAKYELLLKTHPMTNLEKKELDLLRNSTFINDWSKQKIFNNCHKVLCGYTGFALELASIGSNVGLIYNPERLLFNPFDDTNINNVKLISHKNDLDKFLDDETRNETQSFFNIEKKYLERFISILDH